jgi:N-methylhydantoinase B
VPATSIGDLVLKALAPVLPNNVRAGHFGDSYADFVYGIDPRTKKRYVIAEPVAGGYGGKPFEDGEPALFSMTHGDTYNIPNEVIEVKYPFLVERYELIPDSGGPGKYRGGLGVRKDYRILGHEAGITFTLDRAIHTPPWGLFGGKSGRPNAFTCSRNDGRVEHWRKLTNLRLNPNDLTSLAGGGGGGYGSALERDPELVRLDVMNGYVSVKSAREDYGVVIDQTSLKVDYDSTRRIRHASIESSS